MPLTSYTSYDEVRAALGVTDEELEDVTLALPLYEDVLEVELEDINIGLASQFAVVVAKDPLTLTALESKFLQSVRLFSTYAVAKHLTTSLPLFSPEEITDSKASLKRSGSETPYARVTDSVVQQYNRFRKRLAEAYGAVVSSASATYTPKRYFAVVSPSSDPLTGT